MKKIGWFIGGVLGGFVLCKAVDMYNDNRNTENTIDTDNDVSEGIQIIIKKCDVINNEEIKNKLIIDYIDLFLLDTNSLETILLELDTEISEFCKEVEPESQSEEMISEPVEEVPVVKEEQDQPLHEDTVVSETQESTVTEPPRELTPDSEYEEVCSALLSGELDTSDMMLGEMLSSMSCDPEMLYEELFAWFAESLLDPTTKYEELKNLVRYIAELSEALKPIDESVWVYKVVASNMINGVYTYDDKVLLNNLAKSEMEVEKVLDELVNFKNSVKKTRRKVKRYDNVSVSNRVFDEWIKIINNHITQTKAWLEENTEEEQQPAQKSSNDTAVTSEAVKPNISLEDMYINPLIDKFGNKHKDRLTTMVYILNEDNDQKRKEEYTEALLMLINTDRYSQLDGSIILNQLITKYNEEL